jgi:hypothetical protein
MEVPKDGVKSDPLTEDELNANLDKYEGKANPRLKLPDIENCKKLPPADWQKGVERAAAEARKKK